MADLKKVSPGQPFAPRADHWNAFIDTAIAFREIAGTPGNGQLRAPTHAGDVMLVKNAYTGGDRDWFDCAVPVTPVSSEITQLDQFAQSTAMNIQGVNDDELTWCVLLEPVKAGAYGKALISGLCVCWIDVRHASHRYVTTEEGNFIPISAPFGAGQIVYVAGAPGTASSTGEQWVIIRLGNMPIGETGSPTIIAGSGSSARTATWKRKDDHKPVKITRHRYVCVSGSLHEYSWTELYDSCGLLIEVSAES